MLHKLAARAVIRDWESGILDSKKIDHQLAKRNRKQEIIKV